MDNIQDKLNAYKNAISLKENTPAWIAYHKKTPLAKNITVTEWNDIVENIKELASDDEATSAYLEELTNAVKTKLDYYKTIIDAILNRSSLFTFNSFYTLVDNLLTGGYLDEITAGDMIVLFDTEEPDYIVFEVDTTGHLAPPPDAIAINSVSEIPSKRKAGAAYTIGGKVSLIAIESGVSSINMGTDTELNPESNNPIANSVVANALQHIEDELSITTEKANENIERINSLESDLDTVESIALQANQAIAFQDYYTMISELQMKAPKELNIGQNIYINNIGVPDLWVSANDESFRDWFYADDTSDEGFIAELLDRGFVSIGYYCLSMLETQKVDLTEYATKDDLDTLSDEFSQVLTDLHNYAMNLKGGES